MNDSRIHYLFYSTVLLFPPVHELGHYIIALGESRSVVMLRWDSISYMGDSSLLQNVWEYSLFVPVFFAVVWFMGMYKKIKVLKISKGCSVYVG